jgi:hypothetical protein
VLATRYEKTARNYLTLLQLAAALGSLRDVELPPGEELQTAPK